MLIYSSACYATIAYSFDLIALATACGTVIGLEALSMLRCSLSGSLGFSVSRWIAHWCIGVPLTYCVLFRSHRTRTLDGALSMLRQFVLIGALMLHQNPFTAHSLLPVVVSTGYILTVVNLETLRVSSKHRVSKATRTNRFARKGANLFCSTLESALSRFQCRNVSF